MLSENIRLIALDFETTGLDVHNDVPIQIGLLEFDQT
jgi:DNA polymerase III epsilon subunit-like protein